MRINVDCFGENCFERSLPGALFQEQAYSLVQRYPGLRKRAAATRDIELGEEATNVAPSFQTCAVKLMSGSLTRFEVFGAIWSILKLLHVYPKA